MAMRTSSISGMNASLFQVLLACWLVVVFSTVSSLEYLLASVNQMAGLYLNYVGMDS